LRYGEVSREDTLLAQAETLEPLEGLGSNSYYLNLPKRFVAVTAVDFEADEVLIGAVVTLRNSAGGLVREQATDDFGDVLFNQMPAECYQVEIVMPGYTALTTEADARQKDIVLGDLGLERL
jgi:hypothetical protein